MQYYIKDNFYFDIDHHQQLRITGLENHLLLGLTLPNGIRYELKNYEISNGQLLITLEFYTDHLELSMPIVTDIRTLRSLTEQVSPRPLYSDLINTNPAEVMPKVISMREQNTSTVISFTNNYKDEAEAVKKYGSHIIIPKTQTVNFDNNRINIDGSSPLMIMIRTVSNIKLKQRLHRHLFKVLPPLPEHMFSKKMLKQYEDAQLQVEHLIKTQKTSSFEYGTIFPRDWIESADLGEDLTTRTVDYMYDQSMQFISEEGEGWHENIIGEFKTKVADTNLHIDRKMIDIEPRYIIGMKRVSQEFLHDPVHKEKLQLVANYILRTAEEKDLISFKKKTGTESEYEMVGNWRDSYYAYPRQKSPLAPYDVNCVFYPVSLKIIRQFAEYFELKDLKKVDELIEKWDSNKQRFRLYHPDRVGYSLALQGRKQTPLPIAHLDEAYDLYYGAPSFEEIVSFAEKVVDPNYFFTPCGPLLVAADEDEFSTEQYHGKVIWPKQAAFCVAGLTKQYRRGLAELWPWAIIESVKQAIIVTSQACFRAWEQLEAVPELYYYDELQDRARFYTDQPEYEGQMSLIQLWSSVGCRRIVQDYVSVVTGATAE